MRKKLLALILALVMALSLAACGEDESSESPTVDNSPSQSTPAAPASTDPVSSDPVFSGDDDFEMYAAEELTVTTGTSFGETALPDGQYAMVFEMQDAAGNSVYSDAVTFDCAGGEITTTVYS